MNAVRPGDLVTLTADMFFTLSEQSSPAWDRPWEDPRGYHLPVGRVWLGQRVLVVAVPPVDDAESYRRQSVLVVLSTGVHGWLHSDECDVAGER